jgi:formate dehydrogenase major subunit
MSGPVAARGGQVPRIDTSLRAGLVFMTLHFQDDVATNLLTIDATDPKSGTAEFKAAAIRIEKIRRRARPSPTERPATKLARARARVAAAARAAVAVRDR